MLAYTVHDVRVTAELRELPPQDGWRAYERTGQASLHCSCGHSEGPMPSPLATLTATLHIHGLASHPPGASTHSDYYDGTHALPALPGASAFPRPHGLA